MTLRDDLSKQILDIQPSGIRTYLLASGWEQDGELGNLATVWHRPQTDSFGAEVLLPNSPDLRDYRERMIDAVMAIALYEARSPLLVLKQIMGYAADLVRIRVIHHDVSAGTIPLKDGVQLNQRARDLMAAAVMSTTAKRRHFAGKRSPDATNFLDSLRLGQTEVGSYVVNIIAPLGQGPLRQKDLSNVPMANVVTDGLALSLSALDEALDKYGRTFDLAVFDNAVQSGASANLCDALVGLSGTDKQRAFEITVVPASTQDSNLRRTKTFEFDLEKVSHIGMASDYYKDSYVATNQTIRGTIQRLDRPMDEEFGTITVATMIRDVEKHVAIELGPDEYMQAITAHKFKDSVQCYGDLHVSPRKAVLLNPRDFVVLTSRNLFDDSDDT
jgi:hypothetical protein